MPPITQLDPDVQLEYAAVAEELRKIKKAMSPVIDLLDGRLQSLIAKLPRRTEEMYRACEAVSRINAQLSFITLPPL